MSMLKTVVKAVRRKPKRSRHRSTKVIPTQVLRYNSLAALVVDTGDRGMRRFWIRVGSLNRKGKTRPSQVKKGFHLMDVFNLPGLAMEIAKYLARQAVISAVTPDNKAARKELRQDLMRFVRRSIEAKWNGTYPSYLTQLTRRQCRCFALGEKELRIVVPEIVEKGLYVPGPDAAKSKVQNKPRRPERFRRIDEALGIE